MNAVAFERLTRDFFARGGREVAHDLLGKLVVRADGRAARLVEVEAYLGLDDPGSHAYRGPTPRAAIMFGPPGHLYVYFSYGMHWCANVVCGPAGVASAVLLRAAEPISGLEQMTLARSRGDGRRAPRVRDLCRGPGRLTEAFGITGADNGADLCDPRCSVWVADDGARFDGAVVTTPRVGLSALRGAELPWRYVVAGSPWVSGGPRPAGPSGGGGRTSERA